LTTSPDLAAGRPHAELEIAGATIDAVQLMKLAPALARHLGLRIAGD
jgi:hypothetical protein